MADDDLVARLRRGLEAKDPSATAQAFVSIDPVTPLPLPLLAATSNLLSLHRHNTAAYSAFERGLALADGPAALVKAGLNFNALLYACCREPSMLPSARTAWRVLGEAGVAPELPPLEKYIGSLLESQSYDDAFGVFLTAIDASLSPSLKTSAALVGCCAAEPRLAQMSFAVFSTVKAAGGQLPPELARGLARACLREGTLEQAEAPPRHFRDTSETPPRHLRDTSDCSAPLAASPQPTLLMSHLGHLSSQPRHLLSL